MSYFKKTNNIKKTSSDEDGVFSIFLKINASSDSMEIHDDIISAIKEYYNTSEFKQEYVEILDKLTDRIFGEPKIPSTISKEPDNKQPSKRENRFSSSYKI